MWSPFQKEPLEHGTVPEVIEGPITRMIAFVSAQQ